MPMMGIAEELASAALSVWPDAQVAGLRNVGLESWLTCSSTTNLIFECEVVSGTPGAGPCEIQVVLRTNDSSSSIARRVAAGTIILVKQTPVPRPLELSIDGLTELESPYAAPSLFHGPAFQLVDRLWSGADRAVVEINLDHCRVPPANLHHALLDAALHGIPHSDWTRWNPDASAGHIGYPVRLDELEVFGPPPRTGIVHAASRLLKFDPRTQLYSIEVLIVVKGTLWARAILQEKLFPLGALAGIPLSQLRQFIREHQYTPGVVLSRREGESTQITAADISAVNWLPGTVEHIYGVNGSVGELALQVAVREHVAADWAVHPSAIDWDEPSSTARLRKDPSQHQRLVVNREGSCVTVRSR